MKGNQHDNNNYPTVQEVLKDNKRLKKYHLTMKRKAAVFSLQKAIDLERASKRCRRDYCLRMAEHSFMQNDMEMWQMYITDAGTFGKLTKRMIAHTTSYAQREYQMGKRLSAAELKAEHPEARIKWTSWDEYTVQFPVQQWEIERIQAAKIEMEKQEHSGE